MQKQSPDTFIFFFFLACLHEIILYGPKVLFYYLKIFIHYVQNLNTQVIYKC